MAKAEKPLLRTILIEKEKISARIKSMADEIAKDFLSENLGEKNSELILLCVLESARVFTQELAEELEDRGVKVKIKKVRVKSYDGMKKSEGHKIHFILPEDLSGKRVLIVEDMIDTGGTLKELEIALKKFNPYKVDIAVLLEKIKAKYINIKAKYVGFEIFDFWVDGHGVDTNGKHRLDEWISAVLLNSDDEILVRFWRLFILNSEDEALVESVRSLMLMRSWYNEKEEKENEKYKYKDNSGRFPNPHPKLPGKQAGLPRQRRDQSEARVSHKRNKHVLPRDKRQRSQRRS